MPGFAKRTRSAGSAEADFSVKCCLCKALSADDKVAVRIGLPAGGLGEEQKILLFQVIAWLNSTLWISPIK
jgi:hypothetical protein